MSRIIAVANQKGGVGKTTTAINLSACLAEKNKKVLTLDMDPQGNTTSGLGVDKNQAENTVYELILDESELSECIYPSVMENLSVIPSNINLSGAEIELIGFENKEYLLKSKLDMIRSDYDYIIIDCPPSLNLLTINAMAAADSVIVPIQCAFWLIPSKSFLSSLKRQVRICRLRIIKSFHLLPIKATVVATGQAGSSSFVSTLFSPPIVSNIMLHHHYSLLR